MGQWRAAGVSSSLLGHVSASLPAGHALPYKSWNTASPTPSPPSAVYSTAFALGSHGVSTGLPPASTTTTSFPAPARRSSRCSWLNGRRMWARS